MELRIVVGVSTGGAFYSLPGLMKGPGHTRGWRISQVLSTLRLACGGRVLHDMTGQTETGTRTWRWNRQTIMAQAGPQGCRRQLLAQGVDIEGTQ